MNKQLWIVLDVVYVMVLAVYVVAGAPIAPFHGDESMQVYMSRDFTTAFVNGRWTDLLTQPPYDIDSDGHLRLINGTVNRYTIGAAWQIAGYTLTLPRPGWDWGLNYQENVDTGHRPSEGELNAARLPSALFTALSAGVMFLIGRQLGGRPAAYAAAAIYVLNPAILLNGRRATQEGSMLFFGLLTVLIAVWMSRRQKSSIWAWMLLTLAGALTLASKHSGIVFVAAALGWAGVEALIRWLNSRHSPPSPTGEGKRFIGTVVGLFLSGTVMVGVFVGLSPALWNDPPARFVNLLEERARLLDIQVSIAGGAMTIPQRIEAILLQPTIQPVMYYELASWSEVEAILVETARYGSSVWYGYPNGIFGAAILLLVVVGAVVAVLQARRYTGLLVWCGLTVLTLLVNPLAWQRYYLPLIPVIAALAGIGLERLLRRGDHERIAGQ